ncbi:MAG: hypothetical protein IT242_06310 [Bacteroidia bacterium]|nr:hypothetical protein [Bacteroidia bacterium]
MNDLNFKIWTENFLQSILASSLATSEHHVERFLESKLKDSVRSLNGVCEKIHTCNNPRDFYYLLCVYVLEAKNCMYWYERSLEYEQVNLSNSQFILNQGKSMINVLEAAVKVIKYQENQF